MHGNRGMQHQSSLDLPPFTDWSHIGSLDSTNSGVCCEHLSSGTFLSHPCRVLDYLRRVNPPFLRIRAPHSAGSILVIAGGSRFCCSFPSRLILASSAFSSAPTSMAKPVQYNQTISAIAAPSVP